MGLTVGRDVPGISVDDLKLTNTISHYYTVHYSDSHSNRLSMKDTDMLQTLTLRAIEFATKHNEVISTMCHGVRLALLIPKLFLFLILDLAKLCL